MQLKMILISAGTLVLAAASLALGRPARAIHATAPQAGKRHNNKILGLNLDPNDNQKSFKPNELIAVVGVYGSDAPEQVKGDVYLSTAWGYYNPNNKKLGDVSKHPIATDILIGKGKGLNFTIPHMETDDLLVFFDDFSCAFELYHPGDTPAPGSLWATSGAFWIALSA